MSTEITPIAAPPIDSLTELRRQNSALLQRDVAGAGTAKPSPGELLGFLMAAAKLGRSLEDYEQRETAQGIMDFWIANLLSVTPEASEGTRPFTLEPYDECTAHENTTEAHQHRAEAVNAAKRAESILPDSEEAALRKVKVSGLYDWLPKCLKPLCLRLAGRDSDAALMQNLLLRFIRLKESSTEAYSVPLADTDDIFSPTKKEIQTQSKARAYGLLEQLSSAGVVKKQEGTVGTAVSYVLTHDSLLKNWSFLLDIVTQRRAFRQLARGWDNGGRQSGALLSGGEQLQQALEYPHKDDLEIAFTNASYRNGVKSRTYASVVLCSLIGWLAYTNHELNDSIALEKATSEELKAEVTKTNEANRLKDVANTSLESTNKELRQKAALALISNSKLYSLRELLLTPMDENEKPFIYGTSKRIKGWEMPNNEIKLTPLQASRVLSIFSLVAGKDPVPGRPQMEIFLQLDASEAVMKEATRYLSVMQESNGQDRPFDFPARTPLVRRSVPDKITQVSYFYHGKGPKLDQKDQKLADADPDKPIAEEVIRRLKAAGFNKPIEVYPLPDETAPESFIQLRFARDSLNP